MNHFYLQVVRSIHIVSWSGFLQSSVTARCLTLLQIKVGGGGGNINSIRRGWATLNNNSLAHAQTVCFEAGVQGQEVTEVISIPSSKVGLVMGRGGETIRQICIASGAHCQVRMRNIEVFLSFCFLCPPG